MSEPTTLWRTVFDNSPVAMSIIDPFGRQIAANQAYATLLGYDLADIGRVDVGRITREDQQTWTAGYLLRLVSGEIDHFETHKTFLHADGHEIPTHLRSVALRDEDGNCYALLGTLTPSRDRQRVQDHRLRRVLEFSQSQVTILDRDGRIIETTGRYQSVLDYPASFWETRTIFDIIDNADLENVEAFVKDLLANPGVPMNLETLVRTAAGQVNNLRVVAVNLLEDPTVEGILLTALNTTEERRMFAELSARSTTAEAVAAAQRSLLATVSHELRNPLHAIQGMAELLASEQLPPKAAALAATLTSQLTGLAGVTHDLLDTARADAGTVVLDPKPVDLRSLVEEVADFGTVTVAGRGLTVQARISPTMPAWVSADPIRLRQILRNLIGNAVKFTRSGGVTIVAGRGNGTLTRFSVIDTGVGIPADEIDRVLEPFSTGSTAGADRGAGLGLAIVHRFVSAMGGTLQITSTVGVGTTFHVDIPLAVIEPPQTEQAPDGSAKAGETPSRTRKVRVLVVEDNPVNQQLAQGQLDRLGMSAIVVGSGEEALELLSGPDRPEIDVILMDHQLPGIDGLETTQRIRLLPSAVCAVPAILLTASASAAQREHFLASGMHGFVAKPATLADIREAIAGVLTVHRAVEPLPPPAARTVDGPSAKVTGELSASVVDDAVLDGLVDEFGERTIVDELVTTFLNELPQRSEALFAGLDGHDGVVARRAAHTLKSSARLLGAVTLADRCQDIESGALPPSADLKAVIAASAQRLRAWKETGR